MAYTPPTTPIVMDFSGAYTPPASNQANFNFTTGVVALPSRRRQTLN